MLFDDDAARSHSLTKREQLQAPRRNTSVERERAREHFRRETAEQRTCARCGFTHWALKVAPADAPCLMCTPRPGQGALVALALALALAGAACVDDGVLHVSVDDASPAWALPAVEGAVTFLQERGAAVVVDDAGDVRVTVEDAGGDNLAIRFPGAIHLDPVLGDLAPLVRKCTAAHELGHELGLQHVAAPGALSLMDDARSPVDVPGRVECPWSDADEAELQRVLQEGAQ